MDKLWAPWRMGYVRTHKKTNACIFCLCQKTPQRKLVVFQTRFSLAMLNLYPYNNGHLMVAPKRHVKGLSQLKKSELLDLCASLSRAQRLLEKVLNPHGFNIGINTSEAAGAGIPFHLHIHIVPRWNGDTNFMPVIYHTKVISQSLEQLFSQLQDAENKNNKRA